MSIESSSISRRIFDAKVIGTDPATDLAVWKIETTNLPTLALGDTDKIRVGEVVQAIGNPLGTPANGNKRNYLC